MSVIARFLYKKGFCMRITNRIIHFTLSVLLAGTVTLNSGCVSDSSVIDNANQMNASLEPAIMNDPQLAGYLQSIGDRIITAARVLDQQGFGPSSHRKEDSQWMFSNEMQFHLVNSSVVNAFTTGGNHMYVYTALFQACKSEDELAAVMAHEYGHVYARHVQKGMSRQYGVLAATLAAAGVGYATGGKEHGEQYMTSFASAASIVGSFIGMGYTREDEAQADELGFAFYVRAGWDPNKFGDFFQHMIDMGYDTTPAILSDHPTLASRVQLAHQRASKITPQQAQWRRADVATDAQFAALQQRTVAIGKTMPDDSSLTQAQAMLSAFSRSCLTPVQQKDQVQAKDQLIAALEQAAEQRQHEQSGQ